MNLQKIDNTDQCLHHWFERQVANTPDAIAVIAGTQQLSYIQLNERANQLARYLQKLGVKPETLVGICIERSPEMIISMMAVLKSGGAYVPLDPTYPRERLEYMLEDSEISILLTKEKFSAEFSSETITAVHLDTDWTLISQEDASNPESPVSIDNLAYIIYTSGSTGKPKGVLIEHKSLHNFVQSLSQKYAVTPNDRVLQFASISFDVAVEEVFITLVQGATLVLRSEEMLRSISTFLQVCKEWNLSILNLPTAFWHKICAEFPQVDIPACVRLVVIGSERAIPRWLTAWKRYVSPEIRLVNAYGPTEATVGSTLCDLAGPQAVETSSNRVLPIGKPIDNVQTYILDRDLQPVEKGIAGELCIAGKGLARGYLNRPELTDRQFIYIQPPGQPETRVYKTGDWVRYREDGNLEFLDRIDRQEKIRGFRIELSEIESVLELHSSVQQAIVLAWENTPGNKRLVAYVIPSSHPKTNPTTTDSLTDPSQRLVTKLRSYLQGKLPSYMVPAPFILLDSLPLTPNGKVDKRALPTPTNKRPDLVESYVAPLTALEKSLAKLWSTLLNIEEIGINDSFFELGGDSLQTTQLIAHIEKDFKVIVQLKDFFSIPTIAGLASLIQRVQLDQDDTSEHMNLQDLYAEVNKADVGNSVMAALRQSADPKTIFMTGATGFVGTYLLHELLQQTTADIYCLTRAENLLAARKKINKALESCSPDGVVPSNRIFPIIGDLGQPNLGLSPKQFNALSQSIDIIYHCGANVNLLYPYTALYSTNVLGTKAILNLASAGKPKSVHYFSTLDVFESVATTGVREFYEEDNIAVGEGISGGYAQSKWIAEQMVMEAGKNGLPVCIYRPGMVTGHSKTGHSNTSDILCRLLKSLTELRQAPSMDLAIDMTPVDYVSQAIVRLSLKPSSIGKAFHVVNPQPMPFSKIVETLNEFGCQLQSVPYAEWEANLKALPNALSPLAAAMMEQAEQNERTCLELWLGGNDRFDTTNTIKGLQGEHITCPPANSNLLKTYLGYFFECEFMTRLVPAFVS
ncbi:MAG: amino acid adenylation domain-containing protein [Cyanobacteria bacterium J06614_10]